MIARPDCLRQDTFSVQSTAIYTIVGKRRRHSSDQATTTASYLPGQRPSRCLRLPSPLLPSLLSRKDRKGSLVGRSGQADETGGRGTPPSSGFSRVCRANPMTGTFRAGWSDGILSDTSELGIERP